MTQPVVFHPAPGRLSLGDTLRMLVNDGLVHKLQAEQLFKDRRLDSSNLHPLIIISEQKWKNLQSPSKTLTLEALTGNGHVLAGGADRDNTLERLNNRYEGGKLIQASQDTQDNIQLETVDCSYLPRPAICKLQ